MLLFSFNFLYGHKMESKLNKQLVCNILGISDKSYYRWKDERSIFPLLEKYFDSNDLLEWEIQKKINKFEVLNASQNLVEEIIKSLKSYSPEFEFSSFIIGFIDYVEENSLSKSRAELYKYTIATTSDVDSSVIIEAFAQLSDRELNFYIESNGSKTFNFDEIIAKFAQNDNSITNILKIFSLDKELKARPFLFLYYVFQTIKNDEQKNISNYKKYFIEKITNYKIFSTLNLPAFSNKIKKQMETFVNAQMTEDECKVLIYNCDKTIKTLEQHLPPLMLNYHSKRFK